MPKEVCEQSDGQKGANRVSQYTECLSVWPRWFIKSEVRSVMKTSYFLYSFCNRLIHFRCVYRFEAQRDERIRIIIRKIYTRNRHCLSRIDTDTKRSYCFGDTRAKVEVRVTGWPGVLFSSFAHD